MAALDPQKSIVNSFYVGDELVVTAKLAIQEGSAFVGMTMNDFEVEQKLKLVSHHRPGNGTSVLPTGATELLVGDELLLVVDQARLDNLHSNERGCYTAVAADRTHTEQS